jgi:uncharacterized protein YlxW (UPF0749 family)
MEAIAQQILQSGDATAIICFVLCYVIIYFQRKSTATKRDDIELALRKEIAALKVENELMKKDVNYLKDEQSGIKEDVKDIKNTLQTMALSLERPAASAEVKKSIK